MIMNLPLRTAAATVSALAVLGSSPSFADTCFTAFGGTVHYQFAQQGSSFFGPGTHEVDGVVFGALSSCAGLARWPVIGAIQVNLTSAALGFRAMTVAAAGCGAVD